MAKGTRGGQRAVSTTTPRTRASYKTQTAVNTVVDDTKVAKSFDKDYSDFLKLDEDGRVDAISQAITEDVPDHLSNTDFQKVVYNLDFNDKPDLVDDKTLDSMNGTELFRTVNTIYDRQHDLSYTAKEIAKQLSSGSVTRTSDNGGSAYGRGIYFANDYRDSAGYGRSYNDINKTAMVRAKLNSNAKPISYSSAVRGAQQEISSGSKLGQMLRKVDRESQPSIYSLVKGYNVMDNGYGYYVILNRKALSVSKTVKATNTSGRW